MLLISGFLVCAAIIFFAGKELVYYGNIIAEKSGLGKAWVGIILIASVTSLPELAVGISSSAIIQSADLAVGDVLGSCAFNLGILALMDVFEKRRKSVLSLASSSNSLAASLGVILLSFVGFSLFLDNDYIFTPWIGLTSIVFIAVYFISVKVMYEFERKNRMKAIEIVHIDPKYKGITLKKAVSRYILFALIVVSAALFLPYIIEEIARSSGMDKTFAGTLFLAASTSLPEIAVTLSAIRLGAIDIAVGNIFGSNIFNILILSIDDFFYQKGHILKDASDNNIISVFSCIIMSAVAIIGLTYKFEDKKHLLAWDALIIFLIYIFNMILLYNIRL